MKRKKGSSLIFVLVTFALTTILGISVLSLTLVSYQKRIVEVKEKTNQYFSEAGIDIAYGIIGKTVDEATKMGNAAVKKRIDNAVATKDNIIKSDGTLDENKIKETFATGYNYLNADGKEGHAKGYNEYIQENMIANIINPSNYNTVNNITDKPLVQVINSIGVPIITPKAEDIQFNTNDNSFELNLKSTFATNRKNGDQNSGNIRKIISVKYTVGPVKYNQAYSVKTAKIFNNSVWQKSICTDGSVTIQGDFQVDGNVYVQGSNKGGVYIQQASTIFKGVIATNGELKLSGTGSSVNVEGNVYAGNVSVEGEGNKFTVDRSKDNSFFGALYTNNDVEISGKKSRVKINGGFYGINDNKGDVTIDNKVNGEQMKPNLSSAILINTDDDDITSPNGTKIEINKNAVLMGVGYVKTDPQYQTGESVAIKGNYKAYTQPLNGGDYKFEYMAPLTFVKQCNNVDMVVSDKSNYFKNYYNENNNDSNNELKLNSGGIDNIVLPPNTERDGINYGTMSIGSVISGGQIIDSPNNTETVNHIGFIKRMQNKYLKAVYQMNAPEDTNEDDNIENSNYSTTDNNLYKLQRESDKCITTVENQVNFNKNLIKKIDDNKVVCINSDPSKECIIKGAGDVVSVQLGTNSPINDIKGGVIVTNGNVHLIGNIKNFTGTIISLKNVIVDDATMKKLTYDSDYVKRTIADNYEYFNGVFVDGPIQRDNYTYKDISNEDANTDIIRDKNLITMKNWKILK